MIEISHIIAQTLVSYIHILPGIRGNKSVYAMVHFRLLTLLTNETIHYAHAGSDRIHPNFIIIDEAVEWDNLPSKSYHIPRPVPMVQVTRNQKGFRRS